MSLNTTDASTSLNSTSKTQHQTLRKVPTLSLRAYSHGTQAEKEKFIEDLFSGIKDYGFIILKDHGVSSQLLSKAYELLEKVFKLSTESKMKYVSSAGGGQRGYTPFGKEHAKDSPVMDLKEFWHVGRELPGTHRMAQFYPPNIWPTETPEFEKVFSDLYSSLEAAGLQMLEALSLDRKSVV